MSETNKEFRKKLYDAINEDISERQAWYDTIIDIRKRRLGERKKVKTTPYRGAPNFVVQLIDDMVRAKTSTEVSMVLNSKNTCNFISMTPGTVVSVREVEAAFTWLLKYNLKIRAKLEEIIDTKNEIGFGIAKMIDNREILPDQNLPDFIPVDPNDVIVPVESTADKEPERIVHVLRLTERELRDKGIEKQWKNIDEIIKRCRDSEGNVKTTEVKYYEGLNTNPDGQNIYVIWEVYHYRKAGGEAKLFGDNPEDSKQSEYSGSEKWVTIMAPDASDIAIMDYKFDDKIFPFVQFRYENRSGKWYDTRGIGQLLRDDQIFATQCKNAKSVFLDYFGKPLFTGTTKNSGNITFEPGSILPEGVSPVQMPAPPANFDWDINSTYAYAEKRVGTSQQSLSSSVPGASTGQKKTATEVSAAMTISNQYSSDAVERFNEPLQKLFQILWDKTARRQIIFPFVLDEEAKQTTAEIYQNSYTVLPAGNANSANPLYFLQTLQTILPLLEKSPLAKPYEILSFMVSLIDKNLVNKFLFNPEKQGAGPDSQVPIVQQVQQQGMAIQQIGQALQRLQPDLQRMQSQIDQGQPLQSPAQIQGGANVQAI